MFLLPIENAKRKIFTSVLDDSPLGELLSFLFCPHQIGKEIGNGSLSVSGMHTLHDGRTEALAPFALRR
jgi:hypothetical protein